MYASYPEQRPLLYENYTDEERELEIPLCNKRRKVIDFKGQAKNRIKGAAAIISRWPDHWSSLNYVWIILGVFVIAIMLIYNSVVVFALLPSAYSNFQLQRKSEHNTEINSKINLKLPEIYMHVIVNNTKETNYSSLLPHINNLVKRYPEYKYNYNIILNDSSAATFQFGSEEKNNEIAMNSILSSKKITNNVNTHGDNLNVKHQSLSDILDNSPLKKQWRTLPSHFVPLMVRIVSIWDRGGIAFNPYVLVPTSENMVYINKIHDILEYFRLDKGDKLVDISLSENITKQNEKYNSPQKSMSNVNNIRDVIEALENEEIPYHHSHQQNLTEVEDRNIEVIATRRKLRSLDSKHSYEFSEDKDTHEMTLQENLKSKVYFIPMLFDLFFHNLCDMSSLSYAKNNTLTRSKKNTEFVDINENQLLHKRVGKEYKPMIIPSSVSKNKNNQTTHKNIVITSVYDDNTLTIDLKGNILATKTACHAFVGKMFNSVVHVLNDDSVTEFIIRELSIYCNGLLSTCKGLDVLLL